jgi:nucleoid-associated protein YgaU
MRWWDLRRLIVAALAGASALLATACFGGGSSPTPTPQATSISISSTASGANAAPRLPSPSPLAALPLASPTAVRASGPEQTYTIETGDTLGKVAQKYYGDETLWRKIYDANKAAIGDNPDAIKVGTQIKIPPKE